MYVKPLKVIKELFNSPRLTSRFLTLIHWECGMVKENYKSAIGFVTRYIVKNKHPSTLRRELKNLNTRKDVFDWFYTKIESCDYKNLTFPCRKKWTIFWSEYDFRKYIVLRSKKPSGDYDRTERVYIASKNSRKYKSRLNIENYNNNKKVSFI